MLEVCLWETNVGIEMQIALQLFRFTRIFSDAHTAPFTRT